MSLAVNGPDLPDGNTSHFLAVRQLWKVATCQLHVLKHVRDKYRSVAGIT